MDQYLDEKYLDQINQGDYANYGSSVFEPITRAIGNGYQNLAAKREPYAADGQGSHLRKMEMAGSMGGQMPTGEALDAMNQSLGFTPRRYGASAPDPKGGEAIISKAIDRMEVMEPDSTPEKMGAGFENSSLFSGHGESQSDLAGEPSPMPFMGKMDMQREKRIQDAIDMLNSGKIVGQGENSSPANFITKGDRGQAKRFMPALAADPKSAHYQKLIKELSKMVARLPRQIARQKRPADPTDYLRRISGFWPNKR